MPKYLICAVLLAAAAYGVYEIVNTIVDHFAPLGCALNTACNRSNIN